MVECSEQTLAGFVSQLPSLSRPGRHVTAAEALQLGIVDQVTEHNTVDVAVKFALSVTGEGRGKRGNKTNKVAPLSLLWRRRSTQSSYSGLVRHQESLTYGS